MSVVDPLALDREEVKSDRDFLKQEARFAKQVTLPDGRLGILIAGKVITVEPQSAVRGLVEALRNPHSEELVGSTEAGRIVSNTKHDTSAYDQRSVKFGTLGA